MNKAKWVVMLLAVALAVGLVGLLAVSCGGTAEETTTSEVPTTLDPGTSYTDKDAFVVSIGMPVLASLYQTYLGPWMDTVKAASGGRVEFDVKDNNTLVKESAADRRLPQRLVGHHGVPDGLGAWCVSDPRACRTAHAVSPTPRWPPGSSGSLSRSTAQDEYKDFKVLGIIDDPSVELGRQQARARARRPEGPQGP